MLSAYASILRCEFGHKAAYRTVAASVKTKKDSIMLPKIKEKQIDS